MDNIGGYFLSLAILHIMKIEEHLMCIIITMIQCYSLRGQLREKMSEKCQLGIELETSSVLILHFSSQPKS